MRVSHKVIGSMLKVSAGNFGGKNYLTIDLAPYDANLFIEEEDFSKSQMGQKEGNTAAIKRALFEPTYLLRGGNYTDLPSLSS